MMKFRTLVMWIVSAVFLVSCQTETTTFTGVSVNVDPITISAQVNNKGEISISGVYSTPIDRPLGLVTWDVGFQTVLNKAETRQYTLFILYKDDGGQIVQREYAIDQPFEINFSKEQWVRKIQHDGNGNIIVSVELKVAQSAAPRAEATKIPTKAILPTPKPKATSIPTSSNVGSCNDVSITRSDTNLGDILHIRQCSNWTYDTPPFSKGVYALSPEKKYIIYCTNTGDVYMIKIGDPNVLFIENLKEKMSAFQTEDVRLTITFSQDDIHHYALIRDLNSGQEEYVKIPPGMYR